MENLAENLESEMNNTKPASEAKQPLSASIRSGSGKLLGVAGMVTGGVAITTVSVYVGQVAIAAMGLGFISGAAILGGAAIVLTYVSFGLLTKEWNPLKAFKA